MAQRRVATSGFLPWAWRGWLASVYQALKSPEWQAKEMSPGPESHGGIVSKQMTCLDFIFIGITLAALWKTESQGTLEAMHATPQQASPIPIQYPKLFLTSLLEESDRNLLLGGQLITNSNLS